MDDIPSSKVGKRNFNYGNSQKQKQHTRINYEYQGVVFNKNNFQNDSGDDENQQNQIFYKTLDQNKEEYQIGMTKKQPFLKMSDIDVDKFKMKEQIKLIIEDTEVYFPFEPYPQQREYMTKVIQALNGKNNALLQSPTGTGKTLCLLCACLGWIKKKRIQQKLNNEKNLCRIVYSSRTHSQLQQVIKELKSTIYKPKMTVLASRDQYCIKKEFQLLSGNILTSSCQKAINEDDPLVTCQYFRGHHDDGQEEFSNEILDIEDLKEKGNCNDFCPYFYSRRYKDDVDILFLPYFYLLDNSQLSPFNIELTNAIVIFDEAHNVQKTSEDGSSISLSIFHLDGIEKEIALLKENLENFKDPNAFRKLEEKKKNRIKKLDEIETQGLRSNMSTCDNILTVAKSLKYWMTKQVEDSQRNTTQSFEGRDIFKIIKENTKYNPKANESNSENQKLSAFGFGKQKEAQIPIEQQPFFAGIDLTNIDKYLDYVGKAIEDMSTTQNFGLDQIQVFLKLVRVLLANDLTQQAAKDQQKTWVENPINNYKLLIEINVDKSECTIFMQCLDPSQSFLKLKEKNPHNLIFTSGTLSPFDSWTAELKMPFEVKLNNTHVINSQQALLAGVLSKGPIGKDLTFSYDNRQNIELIDDLGIAIINLIKFIPNGVLIIFNSGSQFEACKSRWSFGDTRIMKQIAEIKHIVYEPQQSSELNKVMNEYRKFANSPKGAVLFAVCRKIQKSYFQ